MPEPDGSKQVAVFLPLEEAGIAEILEEGRRLADELCASLHVVHLYPRGEDGLRRAEARAALASEFRACSWYLQDGGPASAFLGFCRQRRIARILLGPVAWRRWGQELGKPDNGFITPFRGILEAWRTA